MGEPAPGDIVDNIFLSVQQIVVDATNSADIVKGDNLVRADATNLWQKIDDATQAGLVDQSGIVQSRVDVTISDLGGVDTAIEVLQAPSYIYARAGATIIHPGDRVKVNTAATTNFVIGQTFIPATESDITNGDVSGRMSRLATDQAGNNSSSDEEQIIIVKLGDV